MKQLWRRSASAFIACVMACVAVLILTPNDPVAAMPTGSLMRQVPDPVDEGASSEQFGVVGPRITPGVNEIQVVGLETWLAIDPESYKPVSWTKDDVNYSAEPTATVWEFSDETVRCLGPGVEYKPGAVGPAPCGRDWDHTTSVMDMTMTVTVEYDVSWDYEEEVEPPEPPTPPPSTTLPPELDDEGNEIATTTTTTTLPPPPPPIQHSGSYVDSSEPGVWNLDVGEIQTNGIDEDAPTVDLPDGSSNEEQPTDRIPGTDEDSGDTGDAIDDIDCGTKWNALYYGACQAFKWALGNVPGLDTVFNLVDGCFENVTDFVSALGSLGKEAIKAFKDPVAFVKEKVEQFKALIAAIEEDPVAFAKEFLGDVIELDLLKENPEKWIGKVGCQIAMAIFTGGGPLAGKLTTKIDDIIKWTAEKKRNRDKDDRDDGDVDDAPSACGVNSFPTGTAVLMADGSRLAIDLVRPGDLVMAANTTTGDWSPRPVLDQWSHLDDGHMATASLSDGSSITATDHHKFWVSSAGAWLELDEVQPGDFLLTPDGVTEVSRVDVSGLADTLVWELDVAVDDTFAVHTGTTDVLVHNEKNCKPASELTASDLLDPNFKVPPRGPEFDEWFDNLSWEELDAALRAGPAKDNKFKQALFSRIRNGGGQHEWCPCEHAAKFRELGIPMSEIHEFTTETSKLNWRRPDPDNPGQFIEGQHPTAGNPGGADHKALRDKLTEFAGNSDTVADFNRQVFDLMDKWNVPRDQWPDPLPSAGG